MPEAAPDPHPRSRRWSAAALADAWNAALGLRGVTIVVADVEEAAGALPRLTGGAAATAIGPHDRARPRRIGPHCRGASRGCCRRCDPIVAVIWPTPSGRQSLTASAGDPPLGRSAARHAERALVATFPEELGDGAAVRPLTASRAAARNRGRCIVSRSFRIDAPNVLAPGAAARISRVGDGARRSGRRRRLLCTRPPIRVVACSRPVAAPAL